MSTVFAGRAGTEYLQRIRDAKGAAAGDLLTGALYGVVSAPDGRISREAGERALVAIALFLAERNPEVVDEAPDPEGLRAYLDDLDTELTPARVVAARGALNRLLVPADNGWHDAHAAAGTLPAAQADVRRLGELVADAG